MRERPAEASRSPTGAHQGTDVVYTQTIGVTSAQVSAVTGSGGTSTDTPAAAASTPVAAAPVGTTDIVATDPSTSVFPAVDDGAFEPTFDDSAPAADFGTDVAAIDDAAGTDVGAVEQAGSGVQTQTLRSVGDQVLLAGFPSNVQPLSASRLEGLYPASVCSCSCPRGRALPADPVPQPVRAMAQPHVGGP